MPDYKVGECYNDKRGKMTILEVSDEKIRVGEYTDQERWTSYWIKKHKFGQWNTRKTGRITNKSKLRKIAKFCAAEPDQVPKLKKVSI